jgi:hypothetical protein
MECVALDVERLHLGVADFDTLFVGGGVERAFDLQAGLGGGRGNQLDHGHAIDEGAPAPGLRDVAEQAMTLTFPGLKLRRLTFNRRNTSQSSQAIHTMTYGALT